MGGSNHYFVFCCRRQTKLITRTTLTASIYSLLISKRKLKFLFFDYFQKVKKVSILCFFPKRKECFYSLLIYWIFTLIRSSIFIAFTTHAIETRFDMSVYIRCQVFYIGNTLLQRHKHWISKLGWENNNNNCLL